MNYKNHITFLLMLIGIVLFVPAGCTQTKKGHDKVSEQVRSVSSFSELEVQGVFIIQLVQGDSEQVKIEAVEEMFRFVETMNEGNKLIVKLKKGNIPDDISKIKVVITLRDIKELDIENVGTLETLTPLKLKKLEVDIAGVGNSTLYLSCDDVSIDASLVGNLTLKGNANKLSIEHSAVGNLKAFDLIANYLTIEHSGAGNIDVNAEKELSINSSGIGNVNYKGNALIKEMNMSGIGKVKKI